MSVDVTNPSSSSFLYFCGQNQCIAILFVFNFMSVDVTKLSAHASYFYICGSNQDIGGLFVYISVYPGNTNGGSITVPLTSCLTGLESAV
jgi:hypothetical protein